MGQITHGVRAVLSNPVVYSSFQRVMGAHQGRIKFVKEFVRPYAGMKILDIGCGPADILEYLPDVDYWGFDISEAYIQRARVRFGHRGNFHCQELHASDLAELPSFDVVFAIGLLHHVDNELATNVLRLASQALKMGGRLLTVDPCLDDDQNAIARLLVRSDRGQHVRTQPEYTALASSVFESPRVEVRHKRWIPYTHCFMECTRK